MRRDHTLNLFKKIFKKRKKIETGSKYSRKKYGNMGKYHIKMVFGLVLGNDIKERLPELLVILEET